MTAYPKTLPVRSKRYLAFVRTKPCLNCEGWVDIQAAHQNFGYGIMGGKVSDLQTIPVCGECHRLEHSVGGKRFWVGYDLKAVCADLLKEFKAQGGKL